MKVLFTGASSFTGYWFVRELARAGHEVVATMRRESGEYEGVRRERIEQLSTSCRFLAPCEFGDKRFLEAVRSEDPLDVLCHHAADVTDYRSPDFDVVRALSSNTRALPRVLEALSDVGCRRIALTGSVFEQDEGAGSQGLPAFSPYGLSKGLTAQVFRLRARDQDMHLGKFVIPNPFGPWEEPRFTAYLTRCWFKGETAGVNTPAYVRDNIHVSLLARAYVQFVEGLPESGASHFNPSGYVESQGAFAQRFAAAMSHRLDLACGLALADQRKFPEPRIRINTAALDTSALGWSEGDAWDELAEYYRSLAGDRA